MTLWRCPPLSTVSTQSTGGQSGQMRISVREWMQADGNIRADGALFQRQCQCQGR